MKHLLYISLIFSCISTKAGAEADSLKAIWQDRSQSETVRMEALKTLAGDVYMRTNPDTAFYFAGLMYDLAEKAGMLEYQAAALEIQANSKRHSGDPAVAMNYANRSLKINKRIDNKSGTATTLYVIGGIYHDQADFDKASQYYDQSLIISEEIQDSNATAKCLNAIGYLLDDHGKYEEAIEYHERCLMLRTALRDRQGMSWTYNNLARVYYHQGKFEKSISLYKSSLSIKKQLREFTMSETQGNLGFSYLALGQTLKAIQICEEGFQGAYFVDFAKAKRLNCDCLYQSYKANGNTQKALLYYEKLSAMEDSLISQKNTKALMEQEMQYDFDMREALANAENQKQLDILEEQEKQQEIISIATAIGALALLIIVVLIFRSLRLANKQKKEIQTQKELVEHKNREITDSIIYAKRIQQAILPPRAQIDQLLPDSFIMYLPKDVVAGDFYWLEKSADWIIFAAADCTGHGVPGAMVSVICFNALNRSVREFGITDPAKILGKTRDLVIEQFQKSDDKVSDGMDISICSWNVKTNELLWAGAMNPIWLVREGELIIAKGNKQPIGIYE
ncbi:tetratricopeptide repeat protein, partial [Crocinitomix catalasitica]|nr:tetratricopeptide repeat protein [Crocinitomix catalasitica]